MVLLRIAEEFSLGGASMGGLVAIQSAAVIIFPLLFGNVADKIGKKKVMLFFVALFVMGCLIVTAVPSIIAFVIGIFILGAGFSMCETVSSAAVADAYLGQQSKYLNIIQCFFCMGAVTGPLFGDYAVTKLGLNWRVVFVVCGVVFAMLFVLILFTKFERSLSNISQQDSGQATQPEHESSAAWSIKSYGILIGPIFGSLLLSITLYVALETGLGFFMNSLFTEKLSMPEFSAAAIALFWFAMMLSRVLASVLYRYQKEITVIAFLGAVIFSLVLACINVPVLSLVCSFVLGFTLGPIWPNIISIATQKFPAHTGMVTGVLQSGSGLGGAISPILMGYVANAYGITISFMLLVLIAAIGCAAIFFVCIRRPKQSSPIQ